MVGRYSQSPNSRLLFVVRVELLEWLLVDWSLYRCVIVNVVNQTARHQKGRDGKLEIYILETFKVILRTGTDL